jgi:Peptidase A4 family
MSRRWCIPITTLALVFGSMFAAGAASAAPMTSHGTVAAQRITPGGRMVRPAGQARPSARGGLNTVVSSSNWSGYAASGGNGAFSSVSASWTEPTGTCTSRHGHQYSSFWVGLDGYNSSSVEQTGTDVDCSGRTPAYYGWYEMYPAFPVNFSNTVRPGDHMSASVTFSGTSTFTLVLTDSTQGWTQNIVKNQTGLARSSAEVIAEAPSSSSGVLPLADFGTVNFTSSVVNGSAIGTFNPFEIIMVDNSGADKDTVSSLSGGENFSATWLRSN